MGIYDEGISRWLDGNGKKAWLYAVLGIVGLIIIIVLLWAATQVISPQAIDFRFAKNPVKGSETTTVFITVTNVSGSDAQNVPLVLAAKEQTEFDVFPSNEKFSGTIPLLSKGTSREVAFIINPVGTVLPGTYVLVAKTTINGQGYEKEAVLTVEG